MYEQAKSIADTQSNNCQKVRERMKAADEVLDKIRNTIRESGLIDGFDDLLQSLDAGGGPHSAFPDHFLTVPDQGTVYFTSYWFFTNCNLIKPIP